jgi:hypothetical protein
MDAGFRRHDTESLVAQFILTAPYSAPGATASTRSQDHLVVIEEHQHDNNGKDPDCGYPDSFGHGPLRESYGNRNPLKI